MLVTKATKIAIRDEFETIGGRALAQFDTDHFATQTGRANWTVTTSLGLLSCQLFDGLGRNHLGKIDPYAIPWVSGRFHDIESVCPRVDLFGRPINLLTGKWHGGWLESADCLKRVERLIRHVIPRIPEPDIER